MANRRFNRYQSLDREVKAIHCTVDIGASGAPTLVSRKGVESITRNSAGNYTIVLQDKYVSLLHASIQQVEATSEDITTQILSESVSTSAKSVTFSTKAAAVETDPSDGSKLLIKLDLKNSDS